MSPNGSYSPNQGNPVQNLNQHPSHHHTPNTPNAQIYRSPKGSQGLNQGNPCQTFQSTPPQSSGQIEQGSTSPHSPPDPAMPPKNSKYTSPNGIHGPKQGDTCQKYQNTHTSPPNSTKQAPPSPHTLPTPSPHPESSLKPKKYTIPTGSYDLNQGNL